MYSSFVLASPIPLFPPGGASPGRRRRANHFSALIFSASLWAVLRLVGAEVISARTRVKLFDVRV